MGEAADPEYLTPDELEELKSSLTMLDVFRARKSADRSEVGLRAYYEAALRINLIGPESSLDDFLVRMRAEDFNEIMGSAVGRAGLPNSRGPENTGESKADFSATTDSGPEISSSSPETNTTD